MSGGNWCTRVVRNDQGGQYAHPPFRFNDVGILNIYKSYITVSFGPYNIGNSTIVNNDVYKIYEGNIEGQGCQIIVFRPQCEQDAVFVLAANWKNNIVMAGIGAYAYRNDGNEDHNTVPEYIGISHIKSAFSQWLDNEMKKLYIKGKEEIYMEFRRIIEEWTI